MSRATAVTLALLALACLATIAFGQDTDKSVTSTSLKCGSTVSRTAGEPDQEVVRCTNETTSTLTLPAPKSAACEASIQTEFQQRNTLARVTGTIENRTCAASTGEYSVGL